MSQVSKGNTRPSSVFGWLKTPTRSSVARQNKTVDTTRAQFLPWPFALAIHSHSAMPTTPETMASVMMNVFSWLTWAAVRVGRAFLIAALVPLMSTREMTRLTVLTAAPAYMSLTAFSTGCGARGPLRLDGLAGRRVGLVHDDLCWVKMPNRMAGPALIYRA